MIILATVCILYIITLTLIIFRPEMKSTFHHTLITLAVVDILFVIVLIIDTQVRVLVLIIDTQVGRFFLLIFCFERRTGILESKSSCQYWLFPPGAISSDLYRHHFWEDILNFPFSFSFSMNLCCIQVTFDGKNCRQA